MPELRERFEALGPWFTRYEIDGALLGGDNSYDDDYRARLFFEWIGEPRSIMELSSFEGAHTLQLAAEPFVERVLGLEGRPENIARARLATELLGRGNVDFLQVDLDQETVELEQFGRFDAVFCAGLLYHLKKPWSLIDKIAKVTDAFFLDTHFSETDEVRIGEYVGSHYAEGGYADPLAGLSEASFWMTLPCLQDTIAKAGFSIRHELVVPDWAGAGPRVHIGAVKG